MSDSEGTTPAAEPGPAEGQEQAAKPTPPPPQPARELPSPEAIADWYAGADCPSIDNLFNNLVVMRYDALIMQIRKEELLPQHWQILDNAEIDEAEFDRLPEIGRLRARYRDQDLARQRTDPLRVAWRELRGKRPNMWTVPDVMAAMRRIIDKKLEVNFADLLSGIRDIWADMTIPFGQEQCEILWAVVAFVGSKTKK